MLNKLRSSPDTRLEIEKNTGFPKKSIMGWREWIALPDLGIEKIKAKIDTGARTCVLHAFAFDLFTENGIEKVRFSLHPDQYSKEKVVHGVSILHELRHISDSGGYKELRPIIKTNLQLAGLRWQIELSLTNRDDMRFRFLLARSAIAGKFLINPSASYLLGKKTKKIS